jgi:ubiquinone/menaquinone biosynthesis C-methylase UbiE
MKDEIKTHWNGRAAEYDKNVRQVIYSDRERVTWQKIFIQALGSEKLKILDVGTGPGIVANLLSDLGHDVTGVDVSESMIKKAMENSDALHHSLELVQGDGERLPFESGSFDAVVNRYVLWTLPDPMKALAEWRRVLKPGGRLVVVDGTWYRRGKDKPLTKKLLQKLSVPLVMITERRVPKCHDLDDDIMNNLWSSNLKRPEADADMFKSLGFSQILIVNALNKRLLTNLDYLKNGHCGERFMISGVK